MASALTLVSVHVGLALRHVQPFSSGARTGKSTRSAKVFNTDLVSVLAHGPNVRFRGKADMASHIAICPLMTQRGHQ